MSKVYEITYRMVDYPTVLVKADSEEEAVEIAAQIDGCYFTPGDYRDAVWEYNNSEIADSPIHCFRQVFTSAMVEEAQ
tara:strand:- start:756 stop:989 length:234 start_codon:yes stop_codon:yes gene_type:complete